MLNFYQLNIIPLILKNFKVNKIIICGLNDNKVLSEIEDYDAIFYIIEKNINIRFRNMKVINDYPLNSLKTFREYDAIFINDDANWYTVYNELQFIKNNNKEFPLTFVCNNKFPNKFRDSYRNPEIIPKEYLHEHIKKYPIIRDSKKIYIDDEYFHATDDNSPKNGVNRAIKDFLNENGNLDILDINFIDDITIIYPKSTISKIRIDKLKNEINDKSIDLNLSKLREYELLFDYAYNFNEFEDSNSFTQLELELSENKNNLKDSKNKIQLQKNELKLKNSKISNLESELDLKESEIKSIESKLYNETNELNLKDNKIIKLENELALKESEIKSIESKLYDKSDELNQVYSQMNTLQNDFADFKNKSTLKNSSMFSISKDLRILKKELNDKNYEYDLLKEEASYLRRGNLYHLSKIESKNYSINCLNETINDNDLEIQYLKKNIFTRVILNPLSYLILIFKSNPKEIFLNIKIYKNLKTSRCFNVGYYLNNNKDILESKWCKYFSPEFHYVCNGFDENRKINKKYFHWNSKKELLKYLLNSN